jgi:hypothetical protein
MRSIIYNSDTPSIKAKGERYNFSSQRDSNFNRYLLQDSNEFRFTNFPGFLVGCRNAYIIHNGSDNGR